MDIYFNDHDKQILRELAKKQLELANAPANIARKNYWYTHNACKGDRPIIQLDCWSLYHEILYPYLKCEGEFAREVEKELNKNFLNQEFFDDDRVTPDRFGWAYDAGLKPFNLDFNIAYAKGGNAETGEGMHFIPVIEDLEEEFDDIKHSYFWYDEASSQKKLDLITDTIGDIIPVYQKMDCLYVVLNQMIVKLMGMENMLVGMQMCPENYSAMINMLADDYIAFFRMLESKNMILPTTEYESVGQATYAFNNELPKSAAEAGRPLVSKDVWGFMDSQETNCISPEMFEELVFPAYKKVADQFGMLSYGCCEPVDPIWDNCISKLTNLRKVSISPWAKEEYMAERLKGTNIIYHRKPSALILSMGDTLDEDAVRDSIRHTLTTARGCHLELTQRDVYTLHNDISRGKRFIDIIKEEVENNWK